MLGPRAEVMARTAGVAAPFKRPAAGPAAEPVP